MRTPADPKENGTKRLRVRDAKASDVTEILKVYAPFITDSDTSFEYDVPSEKEMLERMQKVQSFFPWLICESEDGTFAGYAYATKCREREAYQWIAELGIYLSPEFRGKGVGKILYEKLCEILTKQGLFGVLAGVAGNNPVSAEFHKKMGFSLLYTWKNCGNKFGKWVDVSWYTKDLQKLRDNPEKPVAYSDIKHLVVLGVI